MRLPTSVDQMTLGMMFSPYSAERARNETIVELAETIV
jgi:hypothetical protein